MQAFIHSIYLPMILLFLFILLIVFFLQTRRKKASLSAQHWQKQNKEYNLSDDITDEVSPVRIRTQTQGETSAQQPLMVTQPEPAKKEKKDYPNVLCLYIQAKPHQLIYGYDLMQSILNQGFVHGALNFFHHIENQRTLFSLSAIEPPGGFDLSDIANYQTKGLCVFLQPHRFQQPAVVFDQMTRTVKKIAEELGCVVEDENHHLLTQARLNYWRSLLASPKAE